MKRKSTLPAYIENRPSPFSLYFLTGGKFDESEQLKNKRNRQKQVLSPQQPKKTPDKAEKPKTHTVRSFTRTMNYPKVKSINN